MDWVPPSEDQPLPRSGGGSRGWTSPGQPALHRPRLPAGGVVSAPAAAAAAAAAAARQSQQGRERRGPEGATGAAGSGRNGRRGPTWKRPSAAVELPAAAASRASAVAGAESGHGDGASRSGLRCSAPPESYQRLLQTIAVLEAQRSQAVQDLESLGRHQREALKNPIGFVEKLQKKADIGLPYPQRVVQLPEIVWDQYTNSLGNFEREFKNRKRHTRRVKLVFDKVGLPARPKSPLDPRKDGESLSYSMLPLSDGPEGSNSRPQMIRGRLCDDTKPETFNQLWTVEEQKKLEQLLLKYPPEEVESRRWQKIADELGNRTAKQVASRVQKYFIKLTKAGIPVPGRTPNLYIYSKKSSTSRRQHPLNKHLFKPSTFMTSHEPPVYMDEDDDRSCFRSHMNTAMEEASDEESIPIMYRNLPEYKELLQFKKLKKQKLQQMQAESGFVQHVGFKCDNCGIEPIQGVRWHCQDCPPEMSLDFCDSCSDCLHETDIHKEDHQLEPVYRSETFLDRDYCVSQGTSYNYLDPNYFPANR
ncbi:ZZ-type zinc finger-containing protein 3 isoform X5 [Orcinus orca]|uniref:ZZ-type zinc finger-containing protein 3 isoform X5 n=1 Tax=Orcinus orca TaxID=9733 RepID=UPI0014419CD5|nr:ZZ-type zinc finger-containing protein 3 isoform X5 [Orcinus orca]